MKHYSVPEIIATLGLGFLLGAPPPNCLCASAELRLNAEEIKSPEATPLAVTFAERAERKACFKHERAIQHKSACTNLLTQRPCDRQTTQRKESYSFKMKVYSFEGATPFVKEVA